MKSKLQKAMEDEIKKNQKGKLLAMNNKKFKTGDRVYFGRKHGEQSLGEVVKINAKTLKVKLLEERGRNRKHEVGGVWTVSPFLCTPA